MLAVKEEAINLIKTLPDNIGWDDIMYELYVKQKIETGLKAIEEGKTISIKEAKKRLLEL
ncbi:MAG: hypothetical protein A2086_01670 [Spirochaetes bacterium GWD1_27_9]|nr:MAG: hypothetical protein A2Z98_04060 [Spirochaetes bacterium GWB1_27_13]OHD20622.1 MAG: hypothetical protein A2Y34_17540 [Spirochaetes bacterium GWC1_27_15]OHD41811.1 MAG: hypothetical protein A2086_01670 [Spirochaetes bacterium GWD1_27_9]